MLSRDRKRYNNKNKNNNNDITIITKRNIIFLLNVKKKKCKNFLCFLFYTKFFAAVADFV